jgi:sigma-E factor negative regulatory protein RseC
LQPLYSKREEEVIKHKALVKEISGTSLIVTIINQSACSACHVNTACSMADVREKDVEISHFQGKYLPGQEVSVIFQESLGFRAMFFGYVLPFLIVLITLITFFSITNNEILAGIVGLGILIPYYTTLYFYRDVLKKIFKFELEEPYRS